MVLLPVNDRKSRKAFHETARRIYKDDKVWVCPPDPMIEAIFDRNTNVFFRHGDATRWVLKDNEGRLIGRVAAFINEQKAYNYPQPTGGMGFFECVNDEEAAFLLFDACRQWLQERGMEAMDGPINFGENDNFWGLLVEGFTHPSFGMNYNPPYYQKFFEDYGFQLYFEQVTNHLNLRKPFPERFWKIAEWVRNKPNFRFEHFRFDDAERFIRDLKTIYDAAWVFHENFTPLHEDDLRRVLRTSRLLIKEEFIWFAYHQKEPVAFLVLLPDANQLLKKLSGRMHLWDKVKYLWYSKTMKYTRGRFTIMGVVPQFQKYGIESGMFWELNEVMKRHPYYEELELSWIGDFNVKMKRLQENIGADFAKRHYTYRLLFSGNHTFRRYEYIPADTREKVLREQWQDHSQNRSFDAGGVE
ncbi:MAG TPA: hypothetical protein PLE85_06310 [Bacteroidales bacterium]|nr:hypothetical protein [Bacteroidales bacterium]